MMDSPRLAYLKALDIDVWERRELRRTSRDSSSDVDGTFDAVSSVDVVGSVEITDRSDRVLRTEEVGPSSISTLDWAGLERAVKACTLCALHASRTQAVFGVGNRSAQWMVIGEAPGADEDRQGEPFVGRAGQLLNSMLKAIGLAREQVYIANILKSRPPNNRDPRPEEVQACIPYLYRQIELIDPRLILCVGRIAAQTLLDTTESIGRLRGRVHHIAGGRPMVITYHPAYLLRSPGEKRKAWADLVLAMNTFDRLGAAAPIAEQLFPGNAPDHS
jgi:uracil-DNA glycosylase family 4